MKKIICIISLVLFCVVAYSQGPLTGFFRPVKQNITLKQRTLTSDKNASTWLFRPTLQLTALQFAPGEDGKYEVSSLSKAGMGISYMHYTDNNGVPYANFGVNVLALFPTDNEIAKTTIVVGFTGFQFVSIGAGYDLGIKKMVFLTGMVYSF